MRLAPARRPELTPGRANSRWLGTRRGKERGEERAGPGSRSPGSARASRVMKWLGQDLLLSSPGAEGKRGSGSSRRPGARARRHRGSPELGSPRTRTTSLPVRASLAWAVLPFLQRCRPSLNFAGRLNGIKNFSFGGRGVGWGSQSVTSGLLPRPGRPREGLLPRPESCAGPARRQGCSAEPGVWHPGLWPSSQLPGVKGTCLPPASSLTPPPPIALRGRVDAAAVAGVRSLPEPECTDAGQGRPSE